MPNFKHLLIVSCTLLAVPAFSQDKTSFIESLSRGAVAKPQDKWVDSVYRKLNKKERIAQLLMVRAHTNMGKAYEDSVGQVIRKQRVGGLVFFQGGPVRQAALTNKYQALANVPLLIAIDAEWGLGMRLDSTISYPYQMTLGAIRDNSLLQEMGKQVALDIKRLGMHVNFAPDVDVNNNPANPVIGYRSFGDNKYNVAAKGLAYVMGLQGEGVLVSIKHFPGHGDTDVDSHYDLPKLPFDRKRLDSLEMYPFRQLISQGASGVMVAHMSIPALDPTPNLPSTLSRPIVTGILKGELGFKGIVFSDAMEMKGVVKYFKDGEAEVRGLIAGNDILELSANSDRAIKMIRKAVRKKRLSKDQVEASVKKVLAAKYWTGLNRHLTVDTTGIPAFLNRPEANALNQRLADAAVTVLKSDSLLRAADPNKRTALVSLGVTEISLFQRQLKSYFPNSTNFILSKIASQADMSQMQQELKAYDQVIVAIHDYRKRPGAVLDYNAGLKTFIAELSRMNTITCVFANPYTIAGLPGIEKSKTLVVNYQNTDELQRAAARVISGQLKATGKLPVTINSYFKNGDGL
ncbi:glycoside hydrolase family 3 protein [Hufsiella ginkgonis]|uniref:beta-N-acetylhexosaminidase n=1 Tax=Hufsiella ginkgonis TaxID=2695274 RepID=A0A7K1Y2J2_9SPHI|nr:glycoside hydrolase family 3 protein [Hufsiella ginkgonis]MXV17480.1 glycoside hydrolase family 3 [Hufsiella ginkgonis]